MSERDRLSEIFLEACSIPEESRAAFLDEACAGDPVLRAEIEAMLRADSAAGTGGATDRIVDGAARIAARVVAAGSSPAPERIGPYRILGTLGEGGMGIVYRAEQTEPIRREVALKVLRGGMDSSAFLARFEAERQALAAMDHPNIARVLDAGAAEDGRPYLAMQLIHGKSITDYTRSSVPDLRERVRLFLDVCHAVGHAHQRGIIHRDLKPSNILVTEVHGRPVPKVIDFSIAKALSGPMLQTSFRTRTGEVIGTLEYMSPEQAAGRVDAVDTRSDVYSLGVLLHELVTGELPHDLAGQPLHEAVRRIVQDPPRAWRGPRTDVTRRGRGDLETIVSKCLEKDPDRRYGAASELAEDLERFLDSRPILARPPSTTYQLRKLVGRHRMATAIIALCFLFLVVFSVTISWQLGVQRRERVRAEAEARKARQVSEFMQEVYRAADLKLGHDATIRQALSMAAERIESGKEQDPLARAAVLETIGMSYGQFNEYDEGLKFLDEAKELLQERLPPGDPRLGEIYWQVAVNRQQAEKYAESEAALRRALEIHESRASEDPQPVADDLGLLGLIKISLGELDDAESALRRELRIYDEALPDTYESRIARTTEEENLANVLQRRGRVAESEAIVRKILEEREKAGASTGMNRFNLAFLLKREGKCDEAETLFQQVIDETRKVHGEHHPILGRALVGKGACLALHGRYEEAEADIGEGARLARETLGVDSMDYAGALYRLGSVLGRMERTEEAEQSLRDALKTHVKLFGESGGVVARDWSMLGEIVEAAGRWPEAEGHFRKAVAIAEGSLAEDDVEIAYRLGDLAGFLGRRGRFVEAAPLQDRALKILESRVDEGSPEMEEAEATQAWILDGLGRFDEGESYRKRAIAWIRRVLGDEHPRLARQLYRRAAALRRQGRLQDALPIVRQAATMQQKLVGERDPELAGMLLETAEILAALGQDEEASASAHRALEIWSGRLFVDPDLLERARNLAGSS